MTDLIALCLAVYGLSWTLVNADGPWDCLAKLRAKLGVIYVQNGDGSISRMSTTVVGAALNCPICTSYYTSVLLLIVMLLLPVVLYPFAAVGVVTLFTEMVNDNRG